MDVEKNDLKIFFAAFRAKGTPPQNCLTPPISAHSEVKGELLCTQGVDWQGGGGCPRRPAGSITRPSPRRGGAWGRPRACPGPTPPVGHPVGRWFTVNFRPSHRRMSSLQLHRCSSGGGQSLESVPPGSTHATVIRASIACLPTLPPLTIQPSPADRLDPEGGGGAWRLCIDGGGLQLHGAHPPVQPE